MAPFLSFTAEEAWQVFGHSESVFLETYAALGPPDAQLLARWSRIRDIRELVNKDIEVLRAEGRVGSSLQVNLQLGLPPDDLELFRSLGDDLRLILITSRAEVYQADELQLAVTASTEAKCERCWHYRPDVGHDPAHPGLCARCTSNLFGPGEHRVCA